MAYRDFTLRDLGNKFGIQNTVVPLFAGVSISQIPPSEWLAKALSFSRKLVLRSEKAKSEVIVTPILLDLKDKNEDFFTIHSGEVLNVDKEQGINGECDFLLAKNTGTFNINLPLISVAEAKKGYWDVGVDQCAAQMYGVQLYNQSEGKPTNTIYGCVTNSGQWQFLKLEDNLLSIDEEIYTIKELPTILGIFQHIIDYYKAILEPVEA